MADALNPAARWARVSSILSRALDLPEAQRTAFLADAVGLEPALATEVMSLFEELRRPDGFLEGPAAAQALLSPGPESAFGPYRVVGELGQGGMGVVHLAERSDGQFARRVAIKRIGSAVPSADALRRFGDERQILARLDHPNIARLLDAGVDADGIPYLVMEHVEGVPLTSYSHDRALAVTQRLALFVKVCKAVQHAHQNLVIHRDLKPGNILVTAEGEPKLLDFGIAKALNETLAGDATDTSNRALTLNYASPEQVRGDAVTTASDVYSLGVVLYELLADRKPYEAAAQSLSDAIRLVCETIPPAASQVSLPERRDELRGDLDSIVQKAMEKAPRDRYGSVAELAEDVAAYLDHRPVKARRPSFGYVAWKFIRRHRAGSAAAAALALLLVSGLAAILWQARVAERERARAQQRFEQVRQLANYVIFDLQDSIAKLAGSTTLRKTMVERSLTYLDSLAGESGGDERLQIEVADGYARLGEVLGAVGAANLGDREAAALSLGKARALLEPLTSRHPQDAAVRRRIAGLLLRIYHAYPPEQYPRELLVESRALWEELVREDANHEDNLRGLASVEFNAFVHAVTAERAGNLPHLQRALELFERLLAARPDDADRKRNVALCHKYLAGHFILRDVPRSREHARHAARLDSERLAGDPYNAQAKLDYSFDLSTLGDYHVKLREYDEALRHYEPALRLRRELWEADPPNVYARDRLVYMLTRVAEMHVLAGRQARAAPLLDEIVAHLRTLPAEQFDQILIRAKIHLLRGEVELASGKDTCASSGLVVAWLAKVPGPEKQKYFEAETHKLYDRALERLRACRT